MDPHLKFLPMSLLAISLAAALVGCSGSSTSPTQSTAPSSVASSAATSSAGDPMKGLPSMPEYPVELTPDGVWVAGGSEPGSLSFHNGQGIKIITVQAISEVANVAQQDVPKDVAEFLRGKRKDALVTNQREVTQSGLPAQRFRLQMRNKMLEPSDMWGVVGGTGFKPLKDEPMEVVAVRSAEGLVWLWTEWDPDDEKETLAAFDAALQKVTVR